MGTNKMSKEHLEYWVEVNIATKPRGSTWKDVEVTVDKTVRELIQKLKQLRIISWHFFYESWGWKTEKDGLPHITFRVELGDEIAKRDAKKMIEEYLQFWGWKKDKDYYFGRHGILNGVYTGEVDRFGNVKRWQLVKDLLRCCSEISLELFRAEKEPERLRFCRSDIFHLISNILSRSDYTYKTKAVKLILLEETDLPTKTFGVCE